MKVRTETFGSGDHTWLRSNHGTDNAGTCSLAVADFTAADHYPDGYLPAGLPLNVADLANAKPYTGGDGERLAFLLFDQSVSAGEARMAVPALWHGRIVVANLPVEFTAPSGSNFEFDEAPASDAPSTEGGAE